MAPSVRDWANYSQDSAIPGAAHDCLEQKLGPRFPQYAKASGRVSGLGLLAGTSGVMRVRGRLRPFPGRVARRRWLRGLRVISQPPRSSRRKARSFSSRLAFRSKGVAAWRRLRSASCGAPAMPATPSGGVVLRPEVGRGVTGPSLGVGSRSEGVSCEGSGAGRDVKVRPGAPSAGTSRRFFVQELCGSEGVGERPSSGARMRVMATSDRTRRLIY